MTTGDNDHATSHPHLFKTGVYKVATNLISFPIRPFLILPFSLPFLLFSLSLPFFPFLPFAYPFPSPSIPFPFFPSSLSPSLLPSSLPLLPYLISSQTAWFLSPGQGGDNFTKPCFEISLPPSPSQFSSTKPPLFIQKEHFLPTTSISYIFLNLASCRLGFSLE